MDRWLGDGGMPLLAQLGASLERYGVDGEDLGWVEGEFTPTQLACNPHGFAQAGVQAVLLDAAINFAINAALRGKDRTKATIEMKSELMRPCVMGETYDVRGEVVRLGRQVAYGEAWIKGADGQIVSRATGTFLIHRAESA